MEVPNPTSLRIMGWRLEIVGLPDGYEVLEHEDGLTVVGPGGTVVAEFGPMVSDLGVVVTAAWDDAQPERKGRLQPVS